MNGTQLKILDVLARGLGSKIPIRELTKRIGKLYKTAHYPNVYRALRMLRDEGIVSSETSGRSSLVSINLDTSVTIDLLSELELRNKRLLGLDEPESELLISGLYDTLERFYSINSVSLIDPKRTLKLNRVELLVILRGSDEKPTMVRMAIEETLHELERKLSLRIDPLILDKLEFQRLLISRERNPLKEMLSNKLVVYAPQAFWILIRDLWKTGLQFEFDRAQTHPAKLLEKDIVYNLAKFGFKEMGPTIDKGEEISVEYIVTSILLEGSVRRLEAVPILVVKNKVNLDLLRFLARKYGVSDRLLGLLKQLQSARPDDELADAITDLERTETPKVETDQASIIEKLRLYNAVG